MVLLGRLLRGLRDLWNGIPGRTRARLLGFLGRLAAVGIGVYTIYAYALPYAIATLPLVIVLIGLATIIGLKNPTNAVLGPIGRGLSGAITGTWRWLWGIRPPRQRHN